MYILGINISHDSSSCLLRNGEIIFYQEDERLSKSKHNLTKDHKRYDPFTYYQSSIVKKHTSFVDYIIFSSYKDEFGGDYKIIFEVLDQIKSEGLDWGQVVFKDSEHHLYHASNAAFSSGFDNCACLIVDAAGSFLGNEWQNVYREIESIYNFNYEDGFNSRFKHYSRRSLGSYSDFEIIEQDNCEFVFSDSIGNGQLFANFSAAVGYRDGFSSGKIMGLSSYGIDLMPDDWFMTIDGVRVTNNSLIMSILNKAKTANLEDQQNILKTLQEQTKKHTFNLIKKSLESCNTNNIVLSGGYFLNCVNNYHYLKEFPDVNFYIDPISSDGGTSIGAAKYLWHHLTEDKTIRKLETLYLS